MPKLGVYKNKLVAKYGTNFRYLGIVKNGLDRVTVVTSIPIPRYDKIKVELINFSKCSKALENKEGRHLITVDTQVTKAVREWCARATPILSICNSKRNIILRGYMTFCVMIYIQPCQN